MPMITVYRYVSPLGDMTIADDGEGISGLFFDDMPACRAMLSGPHATDTTPAIRLTREWLDIYFDGGRPGFTPPLHLTGSKFCMAIWRMLLEIPYGTTATYGALAARLAAGRGRASMSAQAVGGAVGRNPVSIIVPCHRVVGAGGSLVGYAGGLERKSALLAIEGGATQELFTPQGYTYGRLRH